MRTQRGFFERRRKWSEFKHEILEKYLRIFVYKLGSVHQDIAFVDTFAGQGQYDDGSVGSPVIAARYNDWPDIAARGIRVFVHAVEADPACAGRLSEALAPWTQLNPPRAVIYPKPFHKVLARILEVTRSMPTLLFFDPYGMRHLSMDAIRPLLENRQRAATEVLMRIDPGLLARFAGWFEERERDAKGQQTAESFRRLVQSLGLDPLRRPVGYRWRTSAYRFTGLFAQYIELLEERFRYVQFVPIRATYGSAPKYYLVHGTDSPHGAAKINDVFSTTEDSLFEESERSPHQEELFAIERPPRLSLHGVSDYALALLKLRRSMTFVDICAELALQFGPEFREKDHREAIKALLAEGHVAASGDALASRTVITIVEHAD